jgi:hypothetical protein
MSMFIEVESVEKGCTVIINLEQVIEIAPLVGGGCEVKMRDDGVSKSVMRVKNDYSEFKQFAMQTVSSEDIANRIAAIKRASGVVDAPNVTETEEVKKTKKTSFKIPKFDGSVSDKE